MDANARLTNLTRLGFATRGLLYLVIAFLVIWTGRAEDPSGALRYLGEGGGKVLLVVMTAGLIAYGLWRLADAAFDIEHHGTSHKGLAERAGAAVSGVVHLLLAWQAIRLMRGAASSAEGTQQGTQAALQLPGGGMLVVLAGVVLLVVGILQLVKAAKASFLRHLEPGVAQQPWVRWSGQAGYAARGVVFMISSYFLVRAGVEEQASEAGGTAQALSWLSSPTDAIVAAGLCCFGLFSLVEARYRQLHDVPVDEMVRKAAG
ncbi:MAG TPA: DUF1206 domain-containing protein [Sphingomonas sp.]|jgi:hypothetical protein|nr:DUF1206 domain-containing protein [Sphingomonas sp.]